MQKQSPKILLTFDVEEFDLPLEYNLPISPDEQMHVGKQGLDAINEILNNPEIECTLFTTANFALSYPDEIANLSARHEIASHTFFHSSFKDEDLQKSREALENIISKKVYGLRMPRMKSVPDELVLSAGYSYNSSINPTWLPGRYNNLGTPRTHYVENRLIKVPISVSPNFRIPLFWLAFKNFPYNWYKKTALQTLKKDGYLSLYFHPWEFTNLDKYKLPSYVKRRSGNELLERLIKLIADLKKEGSFTSMKHFLDADV